MFTPRNRVKEQEEIRGIPDTTLPLLTNEQIIMVAIARLSEGVGLDDEVLIKELYRRGGRT